MGRQVNPGASSMVASVDLSVLPVLPTMGTDEWRDALNVTIDTMARLMGLDMNEQQGDYMDMGITVRASMVSVGNLEALIKQFAYKTIADMMDESLIELRAPEASPEWQAVVNAHAEGLLTVVAQSMALACITCIAFTTRPDLTVGLKSNYAVLPVRVTDC